MKPVTATVTVRQPREEVFDFLDVLANHQRFTDHFLVDWELSGPAAGVGARARMRLKKPGPADWLDMEVVAGERRRRRPRSLRRQRAAAGRAAPTCSRKRPAAAPGSPSASSGSRRRSATVWATPVTRAIAGRSNAKSLRRLADLLNDRWKEKAR